MEEWEEEWGFTHCSRGITATVEGGMSTLPGATGVNSRDSCTCCNKKRGQWCNVEENNSSHCKRERESVWRGWLVVLAWGWVESVKGRRGTYGVRPSKEWDELGHGPAGAVVSELILPSKLTSSVHSLSFSLSLSLSLSMVSCFMELSVFSSFFLLQ